MPATVERLVHARLLLLIAIAVLIASSGIRFSDGSILLAISHGATVSDTVFSKQDTQYHWDSPLKVALLRLLPARIAVIALVFSLLAFLPLCALLPRRPDFVWLALTVIFFTPAFRVSIQNIGVGDGLVVALALVSIHATAKWILLCAFLLIGLWHPHQSFFIGLSLIIAEYCYRRNPDRMRIILVLGCLALICGTFLVYRVALPFEYHGRAAYMVTHGREFFARNVLLLPIALVPTAAWFTLINPLVVRGLWIQRLWIAAVVCISLFTFDVTRVITLILLPIFIYGARSVYEAKATLSRLRVLGCAVALLLTPVVSWSGLDIFLWTDLLSDLNKWGFLK